LDRSLALSVTFAAFDRLTAPLRRMAAGARSTGNDMAETRKKVLQLERSASRLKSFQEAAKKFEGTERELAQTRQRMDELRASMEGASGRTGHLAQQFAAAERRAARLADQMERQRTRMDALGTELSGAGVDIRDLAAEERRLGTEIDRTNTQLEEQRRLAERADRARAQGERMRDVGSRISDAGVKSTALGIASAAPLAVTASAAIRYETALAGVKKVVSGTDKEIAQLSESMLALSTRVPMKADAIAEIVAAGAQSNIARQELVQFAEDAAKMGIAFDIEGGEAGKMMAAWRAAFGLNRAGVVQLADQINLLGNKAGAPATVISEIVTRIGPLGGVAGLASGQIAAMGATLASMGIESEIAATGIKNTMLALTKGTSATKSQEAAFKKLGLSAVKVSKDMQRDAAGTITDVMRRIGKVPKAQQAGMLTELFGSESVGAIAPLLTQLDRLSTNLKMAADRTQYAGSMQAEFDGQNATTAAGLDRLQNRVDRLKIRLGDQLLPVVERVGDKIGKLADRMTEFADRHPAVTKAVMVGAAVLSAAMVVIGGLAVAIGTTLGPLAYLVTALRTPAAAASIMQRALQMLFAPFRLLFGLVLRLWPLLRFLGGGFATVARFAWMAIAAIAGLIGAPVWAVAAITAAVIGLGVLLYVYRDKIFAFGKQVLSAFQNMPAMFKYAGQMMMEALLTALSPGRLVGHLVSLAQNGIAAFKAVLGIHSPSRVFAAMGGHIMGGLSQGLTRDAARPVGLVRDTGNRLTRAMAITVAAGSPAAAAGAATAPPGYRPPPPGMTVHIASLTIHAQPGQSGADLARDFRKELEKTERDQERRARSAFVDDE